MKGYSVRCYGTDLSGHRRKKREEAKSLVSATTIYKGGLAFHVPREMHYSNGKVKTSVYNMIKNDTVADMIKLGSMGVTIAKANVGEAV